jgi:hypothetical protein
MSCPSYQDTVYFFEFAPTSPPWPKAKRLVDAVDHTLLEGDLA